MTSARAKNKFPKLLPGDIICVSGKSLFSRLIIWCESRLPGAAGKPPRISHIAIVRDATTVVEAVGKIRLAPISEYEYLPVAIYRHREMPFTIRQSYVAMLMTAWNEEYGWTKILLFLLDTIFFTYWFTQHWGITSFKVCSEFAAWGWQRFFATDLLDGVNWRSVDPERLTDWICLPVHGWDCVFDGLAD